MKYFKRLRRKVGVATLLLAAIVMLDCLNTKSAFDEINAHFAQQQEGDGLFSKANMEAHNQQFQAPAENLDEWTTPFLLRRFSYLPHLSLAVPLALLSAYLLLSKPREKPKPAPTHV